LTKQIAGFYTAIYFCSGYLTDDLHNKRNIITQFFDPKKIIKTHCSFQNDDRAIKLIYLAI
jgi:hypothetical protein